MADLLIGPVTHIQRPIRADFLRDGDEVHVVRSQEVGGVFADVGAGVRVGVVRDEAMAVEVAEEELVAIRRREKAALINGEAAVRVTAAEGVGVVVHHACAGRFVEADIGYLNKYQFGSAQQITNILGIFFNVTGKSHYYKE